MTVDLVIAPQLVEDAATNLGSLGASIQEATAAASYATTVILPAGADEVSAALSALFSSHGAEFQALAAEAEMFHQQFVSTLTGAYQAYAAAEGVAAQALRDAVTAGSQPLVGALQGAGVLGQAVPPQPFTPIAGPSSLIMGATNIPYPDATYVSAVTGFYAPGTTPNILWTPQQLWPLTPQLGGLTLGQSVNQGVSALHGAIAGQMAAGGTTTVFGASQGAIIETMEMRNLVAQGSPWADQLSFVMAGNPMNPSGGLMERFTGAYIPIADLLFSGATPADSLYHTSIYTNQYDGIADFPRYPLNPFSTANAIAGALFGQHDYTSMAGSTVWHELPTSPGYTGNTHYFKSLSNDLPLLRPLRQVPFLGNPLAELIQPDLRVLVDLGYGSGEYANLPTPASLIGIPNPTTVLPALGTGAVQGAQAFGHSLGLGPAPTGGYPYTPVLDPGLNLNLGQSPVTGLSLLTGLEGVIAHGIFPN